METISGKVLERLGWKITGEFPEIKKSIIIFALLWKTWNNGNRN